MFSKVLEGGGPLEDGGQQSSSAKPLLQEVLVVLALQLEDCLVTDREGDVHIPPPPALLCDGELNVLAEDEE